MNGDGYYYLHTNGALIHKRFRPEDDSPFVRRVWAVDVTDRKSAWTILIEGLALGASVSRIQELATKWHCDARDFCEYLCRVCPNDEQRRGAELFLKHVVGVEPDKFWDGLAKTPKGEQPDIAACGVGLEVTR